MTLRSRPAGVVCLPDEASSTSLELNRSHCDGYESLKSFGGFLIAQDPSRHCDMRSDLNTTTVSYFLHGPHRALSISLAAAQSAPNPTTPLTKPSRGGDRQQGDVVATQSVSVLTRPWMAMVET